MGALDKWTEERWIDDFIAILETRAMVMMTNLRAVLGNRVTEANADDFLTLWTLDGPDCT